MTDQMEMLRSLCRLDIKLFCWNEPEDKDKLTTDILAYIFL